MKKLIQSLLFAVLVCQTAIGQDPARFQNEIDHIRSKEAAQAGKSDLVLFTGSSSIRLWNDLTTDFPGLNLVNTGFGGSHMSDLLYFADVLILPYKPVKIIIYEGDNDIESGKNPDDILADAARLLDLIRGKLPKTPVYFISAKPSPARWHLKNEYKNYNRKLGDFAKSARRIGYINVWDKMLDKEGNPRADLFTDDKLHMNRKGYDIWKKAVAKKAGI